MFRFSQAWTTDVVEAKALAMFAYMMKAKRVMEIGMFTGYGALTIAEVLPPDGKIVDTPLIWDNPALKPLAERWVADMPIGKLCQVTDLQAAIVYLASEASDYMVGHNLVIEGGQSLW